MIIYRITSNINKKIYIGQTIVSLKKRWMGHLTDAKRNKNNHPLYNAIKKYGKENFTIEEIDGANSQSELNYKEWLLIYKFNSLWPNGYNMTYGGGSNGKPSSQSVEKMRKSLKEWHKKNTSPGSKKVINIETGEIYDSCSDCARKNGMNGRNLSAKLLGKVGNQTPFRYVGMEYIYARYHKNNERIGKSKKVINIETREVWASAYECFKGNDIKCVYSTFKSKLNGAIGNETPFRYIGQEKDCKKYISNCKKIIDIKTGKIYDSIKKCEIENNLKNSYLKDRLNGKCKHTEKTINFKYLDNIEK